ncbi:MAG: hypothetical protein G01um101424_160 [Parcubacteria group bacterium Gr01-1014_24]|nr:MAG: hypothetical protein G01um101424_160 [Parcubacteria group bacterium Gr01-1014_24]
MSGKYESAGPRPAVLNVTGLGDGLKLVATRKLNFTREEAEKLLGHEEFVGDRTLKNRHVDYLIQAMERSTFHPEWVSLVVCKHDGKTYRMNGQHCAWARSYMPRGYECAVTMLEYTAKSMEDMRTLYSSIDRSSPRTRANVITSYLAGTTEFEGVKSNTLRVVPMGFAMWLWKTKHERRVHDGDDVAYLIKTEHYDLARKVAAFLDRHSSKDYKHLLRSAVVGAMFATFNKAPQVALEFWGPIATGTGIEKVGDPRLRLRNELQRVAVDSGQGSHSDKRRVSQELMFRECITAWNAFRDGRLLQVLKAVEKGNRPGVK